MTKGGTSEEQRKEEQGLGSLGRLFLNQVSILALCAGEPRVFYCAPGEASSQVGRRWHHGMKVPLITQTLTSTKNHKG